MEVQTIWLLGKHRNYIYQRILAGNTQNVLKVTKVTSDMGVKLLIIDFEKENRLDSRLVLKPEALPVVESDRPLPQVTLTRQ